MINRKNTKKVTSQGEFLEVAYARLMKEYELLKEENNSLKSLLSHKEDELTYFKKELNKVRKESNGVGNEDLLFALSRIKNSIPQRTLQPSAIFSMDVEGMLTNITTNLDSTIKKLQERQEAILNETEEREKYVRRKLYEL
jgi:archaellum component FlaC